MKGIEDRSKTKAARLLQVNKLNRDLEWEKSKNQRLQSDYDEYKTRYSRLYQESNNKIDPQKYDEVKRELSRCKNEIKLIDSRHKLMMDTLQHAESELKNIKNNAGNLRWVIFWLIVIIVILVVILYQ